MTFATGLRTVLRQDPDVIMVGEIRDTGSGDRHSGSVDRSSGLKHVTYQQHDRHHHPPD